MTEKPTRHFPVRVDCTPGQPDEHIALCGYRSRAANEFSTNGKVTCPTCLAKYGERHEEKEPIHA